MRPACLIYVVRYSPMLGEALERLYAFIYIKPESQLRVMYKRGLTEKTTTVRIDGR